MGLTAGFDVDTATVHLVATGWGATVTHAVLDRFDNPQRTNPTVVRGGVSVPVTAGDTLRLADREFTPGVANTYRVRAYNAADEQVTSYSYTAATTPVLEAVWLRSATRPFLDRPVTVTGFGDVSTPGRGSVIDVLSRRLPVAVTEVRASRRYDLIVRAADTNEAEALELALSFGDTMFVHTPAGCVVPRSMHAFIGDVTTTRPDKHDSPVRYLTLPLTEVAAPDPAIVGATITWAGVASTWATWADVAAANNTWLDLATYYADPRDETVG